MGEPFIFRVEGQVRVHQRKATGEGSQEKNSRLDRAVGSVSPQDPLCTLALVTICGCVTVANNQGCGCQGPSVQFP